MIPVILCSVVAFLLGSIPFGLLIARLFKAGDLRQQGSGNIGATNVTRVLGFWPAGLMTFVLDMLKGFIPVLLVLPGLFASVAEWIHYPGAEISPPGRWAVGFFAVCGHCFSPWLRFKGGKGVATGLGVILALSPWAALVGAIGFLISCVDKRTGSLASLTGLLLAAVCHLVLSEADASLLWGGLICGLILFRHRSNLDALLENRETRFQH